MIYSYYCVDCGRKLEGGNIIFHLNSMLGIDIERQDEQRNGTDGVRKAKSFDDQLTLYITWKELREYFKRFNAAIPEEENVGIVRITLQDVMEMFAKKAKDKETAQKIREMGIEDIWKGEFVKELTKDSVIDDSFVQKEAERLGRRLEEKFQMDSNMENNETENQNEEKKKYYKEILVSPEFIENTDAAGDGNEVYTLRYTTDSLNEKHLVSFRYAGREIRGYCPLCHAPVLQGTGKYRHLPIGFIGGSRAGKTSLIIAMLSELLNNPTFGLPSAIELADSKVENLKRQQMLYQKGWKVEKTQPQSVQDSFNASVRVRNGNGKGEYVVLTLVDIAGELCLNKDKKFDSEAVKKYPLINHCALYLFCTCISDAGFTIDGGEPLGGNIFAIVNGITEAFERRKEGIPPFGIVLTKADYINSADDGEFAGSNSPRNTRTNENPFRKIELNAEYFSKGYEMNKKLINLFDRFRGRNDYIDPLQWVCKFFQDYKNKIYMSFFYCSATGQTTIPYKDPIGRLEDIPQNLDDEGHQIHFKAAKVDILLWWLLSVAGCIPVEEEKGYCCYDVPIYGEAFAVGIKRGKGSGQVRQEWPWTEWKERNEAVFRLFLNPSELDSKLAGIMKADREASPVISSMKTVFGNTVNKKCLKEVRKYINKK